jgi:DtxR family Mn-dependent transcriptional regulator
MGKVKKEQLSSSIEDYLEAIGYLEKEHRVARVKDIAERLNVQMPSVTGALKVLRGKGLVNYKRNSYITLTEEGLEIANSISLKHRRLARFLRELLLLSPEKAQDEACRIEHAVSDETVTRLVRLMEYLKKHDIDSGQERSTDWEKTILGTSKKPARKSRSASRS